MFANDRQVGGNHYKHGGEEHWDRMWRLKADFFQYQITKYVERCWLKNGIQDLEKARHFLDKYIELKRAEAIADAVIKADAAMRAYVARKGDRRIARDDRREWPFGDPAAEPQAHGYVDQDRK